MTEFERGAKVRRINTLMSACRLIPNREDILALWDARSYDELTDDEIVALQAHLTKLGMYALPEDWTKVNRFLLQRRICGRLLYMLDAQELQALVRKLRAIGDKKPATTSRPSVQVTPIYIIPGGGPTVVN